MCETKVGEKESKRKIGLPTAHEELKKKKIRYI